jgi:AcrR family transcriptional regulator
LLHYFPSKEAILIALLESRDAESGLTLDQPDLGVSFLDMMDGLPEAYARLSQNREMLQLWHALLAESADPNHPAHDWVKRREERIRTTLIEAMRRSVAASELPESTDVPNLAAAVLGAVEGLESQWLLDQSVSVVGGMTALAAAFQTALT